jgi:hypothetical protein
MRYLALAGVSEPFRTRERFHRCMPHALVAVDEGMLLDGREAKRRGLIRLGRGFQ